MLQQRIEEDLKQAMKNRDKTRMSVLSLLKTAIQYATVEKRESLTDDEVLRICAKEVKSRQEAADLYEKAEAFERRDAELTEKAIIEEYLPEPMDDNELEKVIDTIISEAGPLGPQTMGRIIQLVREKVAGRADGARIARAVKARL
jgi:uncharacterized protein